MDEAHLQIDQRRVANDYTASIRDASTTKEAFSFYANKYEWTISTLQNIHWDAHSKAITSMSGRQYKAACQLIHPWLPENLSSSN
jgi:hypothetical protein